MRTPLSTPMIWLIATSPILVALSPFIVAQFYPLQSMNPLIFSVIAALLLRAAINNILISKYNAALPNTSSPVEGPSTPFKVFCFIVLISPFIMSMTSGNLNWMWLFLFTLPVGVGAFSTRSSISFTGKTISLIRNSDLCRE